MYSLTFKLQPAAVVCNLNRSFTKNSRFIQPNGHSAIQISNKLTGFYWLRVIRAGNFRYARGDMRGFKNFKGSDSRCPSINFLFYDRAFGELLLNDITYCIAARIGPNLAISSGILIYRCLSFI